MLHSISSEFIDLEEQYNTCYITTMINGGDFARRFDGKKHIATVTEHATQQVKNIDRRFDGKKYIINEDNCAEHWNKKACGKMSESKTDVKWKSNDEDDESAQTTDFLHSPNAIVEPYAYPSQLINLKNMKKVRNIYDLDRKNAAHFLTINYRSGKRNDETQVT